MIPGSSIQALLWDLFSNNLLPTVLIIQISLVKIIKNAPWRILARSLATIYIFARVRIILKSVLLSGHLINRYPSGKRFSIIYALCRQ